MLSTASSRVDFHAKRYFLTYAQSGETTKEELLDFLQRHTNVTWYIIGREAHKDGGYHLHAYLEWNEQKRVRDANYFDYGTLHPNIQTVRNAAKCQEYCTKDGDYIANMEIAQGKRTYGSIIADSRTQEEFLTSVEATYPRDMVLHFDRIRTYANHRYGQDRREYTSEFSSFVVPEVLEDWVTDNIKGNGPAGPQSPAYQCTLISSHAY